MRRRPPRSTLSSSSAASDVYKRQMSNKLPETSINADLPKEMVDEARISVLTAFETESQERAIATHVKREFEKKHGGLWYCIEGKNFGAYESHETKRYIYLTYGQWSVLLWKSLS
eukprot:TRINITY_DN6036_c0_g1_i1.p1 TRINITY_DN6036_c0_g1~~TRINITY_DN6036_c0_g1_i1.p1  ORF type:complete len:115 (+),score=19.72 TRINITY_DN6036_c0_g1_i1:75-419(+)